MIRVTIGLLVACLWTTQSAHGAEFLFGDATLLGPPINTTVIDHSFISADGRSMYVTSGLGLGPPFGGGGRKALSVFRRASDSDPWGTREDLGANVNGGGSVGIPSVTEDELSLFFSDTIAHWGPVLREGFGGGDLWFSTRPSVGSDWGEATNVGETVNSPYLDADASISADGLSLFFISNRPGGSGDNDIWTSSRTSLQSPWQAPKNLGPIVNTPGAERTPSISPDGLTLFYVQRPTTTLPNLFATSRSDANSPWQEPVNLGPKINTSRVEIGPQLSADGSTFYFSRAPVNCNCSIPDFEMFSVPVLPFERASLQVGLEPYRQDFDDALGADGSAIGTVFPSGWAQSENGVILENTTTQQFPVESSAAAGLYNAGAEGSLDRTLAINASSSLKTLQLLADVNGTDASSFQLQFDVEAWDARDGFSIGGQIFGEPDNPGEAAFNVTVEIDSGSGFTPLVDFGTVTTGAMLQPVFEGIVDGNADANRVSFDSDVVSASIPAGAQLRVRWEAHTEAETNGWVFGLDNVSLSLFGTVSQPGDFNGDSVFDVVDLDALIGAGPNDTQFDLDENGIVDTGDRDVWISDIKNTFVGDINLDGEVNSADLNTLALNWRSMDATSWAQGDFNGDGTVNASDLNDLALNWRSGVAASTSAPPVPEPLSSTLLLLGIFTVVRCSGRRMGQTVNLPAGIE